MTDVPQFDNKVKSRPAKIPPAMRHFIDSVIVPALVREYLAVKNSSNALALGDVVVAESGAMTLSPEVS